MSLSFRCVGWCMIYGSLGFSLDWCSLERYILIKEFASRYKFLKEKVLRRARNQQRAIYPVIMLFYRSVYFSCILVILRQAVGNRWWNIPTCRVEILTGLSHSIRCEKALDEEQNKSSPNAHRAAEFSIIQDARAELSRSVIVRGLISWKPAC